jgi:NAD-dependent deacetylase
MTPLSKIINIVNNNDRIVFVTGAGISTLSGIPDFNTMKGIKIKDKYFDARTVLSRNFVNLYKQKYLTWISKLKDGRFKPNKIHHLISKIIKTHPDKTFTIITQNIDTLHQQSKSFYDIDVPIYTIHGNIDEWKCPKCYTIYGAKQEDVCLNCHNNVIFEPNITLYSDPINESQYKKSFDALSRADAIIVLGTELAVRPISNMVLDHYENVHVFNKTKPPVLDEYPTVDMTICDFNNDF